MSEWQSIKTAPKDGTDIVVLSRSLGPVICAFERGAVMDVGFTAWRVKWDGDYLASEPTHWMPLPAPPEGA